jgi:hypothetical protein
MDNLKFYRRFNERLILQLLVAFAIISITMLVLL